MNLFDSGGPKMSKEKVMAKFSTGYRLASTVAIMMLFFAAFSSAEAEEKAKAVKIEEAAEGPVELLTRTSDEVIKLLKEQHDQIQLDPKLVYRIVDDYIVPHLDDVAMAKLALGKNWRKADNKQKIEFVDQFRILLIRTYSKSLQEFSDEKIDFFPLRDTDDPVKAKVKKVTVKSEVIRSAGPKVPVSYRMRLKDKAWKVYDINIDGVSLVTSYRGTFAQEVRKGGMTGLLKMLHDKNSKVVVDDPPGVSSSKLAS
jgi:phospholipid transport system substrate-binding protein